MKTQGVNMGAIKKINISGFKSIKNLKDFELSNLNIFVGANGTGKSNFIQIFTLLMNMCHGSFQEYIKVNGGADMFLHLGRKITPQIDIEFEFESKRENSNSYHFSLIPTINNSFEIKEEKRFNNTSWQSYGDPRSESRLEDYKNERNSNGVNGVGHYIYEAISKWVVYHFHDTGIHSAIRSFEIIQDNKYLRPDGKNLAPYLLGLKKEHPISYNNIINSLKLIMPFFEDFTLNEIDFGPYRNVTLSWKQKGSDYPMQVHHFSDGSIRLIALLAALNQPNPPETMIFDEPELGLHPEAIALLAEHISVLSKTTQIILATQSTLLLDCFYPKDIITVNRKDGATYFERLNPDNLKIWLDDYTLGELWKKNIITAGTSYE